MLLPVQPSADIQLTDPEPEHPVKMEVPFPSGFPAFAFSLFFDQEELHFSATDSEIYFPPQSDDQPYSIPDK